MAATLPTPTSSCQERRPLDTKFRETLRSLEDDFFASIGADQDTLFSFHHAWTTFAGDIESSRDCVSSETLCQVLDFGKVVEIIASSVLALDTESEAITHAVSADLTQVLNGMNELSLNDHAAVAQLISTGEETCLPHVKATYDWLLSNLHNPYPSKEVRTRLSLAHNTPRKHIDGWFVDARKRIGWNSICKAHFESRKDMIDAATAFFSGTPIPSTSNHPSRMSSSSANLGGIFVTLENRAKNLYSNKLDVSLDSDSETSGRGRKRTERCDNDRPAKRRRHARAAYPSPPASTHGSPSPVSPSHEMASDREYSVAPSTSFKASACLSPSPTATVCLQSPSTVVTSLVMSHMSQPSSSKRKRSSSCAEREETPISKRARRTVSAPAHSADFAHMPALDSWPSPSVVENFDFGVDTPPVEAVSLTENVQWDTSNFERLIAALQREDTPELSDSGSSPYSAASPGLSDSSAPEFLPNLDFTTYPDPSNHALSVEPEPLIFYNSYNNTPDPSTDIFSTLLQPSGQYDMSLTPLDIMPNSWLSSLDQENLDTWSLQPIDKGQTDFYQSNTPIQDDLTAKLLRAQQLREELRKLERDIQA